MNYLSLIGFVAAICGILSFFITLFSKYSWGERMLWFFVVFVLTFSGGLVIYYSSEVERLNGIHRKATLVLEDYNKYGPSMEFIQESLTFLEENKDKYPDAYERAQQIYVGMERKEDLYAFGAAYEIRGIVRGIANLNGVEGVE